MTKSIEDLIKLIPQIENIPKKVKMVYKQLNTIKEDFNGSDSSHTDSEIQIAIDKERSLVDGRIDLMMFSVNKVQESTHEV